MPKKGFKHSQASKNKMSVTHTDMKHSEETKARMSISRMGNQNAAGSSGMTPEQKGAMSTRLLGNQYALGYKQSQEQIEAKSGKNSCFWKGGKPHHYGPDWPGQRKLARARDNYTCQKCSVTEEKLGRELDVHHKISFNETQDNNLSNLVCLCVVCHPEVERAR